MKKILVALVLTSCAQHITAARAGWRACSASGSVISCHGKEMARIECIVPEGDACGALAVLYAGGERVYLYKPVGFDPEHPAFTGGGAVRPEVASDGGLIWFRDGDIRGDEWHVYDPQSGVEQIRDAMSVSMLRINGSIPLWTGSAK
jgi:hypothetical protein